MATERTWLPLGTSGSEVVSWAVLGTVVVSLLVIPGVVLWIGTLARGSSPGVPLPALGVVALTPGILMGAGSLLVMIGRG